MQDKRYAQYVGKLAIVPLTFGRHVPIIADRVSTKLNVLCSILYVSSNFTKGFCNINQIKAMQKAKNHINWALVFSHLCHCCDLNSRKLLLMLFRG